VTAGAGAAAAAGAGAGAGAAIGSLLDEAHAARPSAARTLRGLEMGLIGRLCG